MNKIIQTLAFALAVMTAAAAHAQVTGTSLPNKITLTSGNYTTTGTFVYTDAIGVGVAKVTVPNLIDLAGWGPLDTGVLAGLQLNGSMTSTGTATSVNLVVSGTTTFTGYTLHTGVISHRNASTSGVSLGTTVNEYLYLKNASTTNYMGFSLGYGMGFAPPGSSTMSVGLVSRTAGSLSVHNGSTGLGDLLTGTLTATNLVGTTLTIGGNMTLTGQVQIRGYHENFGRVDMRNTQSTKLSIGTVGQQFVSFADTIPSAYMSVFGGYGIGFSKDTGGVLVGIASTTDGLLKITNGTTTSGFGTIQTGGFASNFRAITTTGNLLVTDSVVTTTTNVTVSLPSTSITGQQFIVKNIGTVTNTVSVVGGVKTIDGATTQAIISGAGKSSAMTFTYDGTNYIISQ